MERSIDRSSYRRSLRMDVDTFNNKNEIKEKLSNNRFHIVNYFMNQIIISMLIIIGVLTAQYFEVDSVTDWISHNMSGGYSMTEIISKFIDRYYNNDSGINAIDLSGDSLSGEKSGDDLIIISGEAQTNSDNSGEFISAVEGINQMMLDAEVIKEKYVLSKPLSGTITSIFGSREDDNPIVSSYHAGTDIGASSGTTIYSAHDGTVILAKSYYSYGNCIMIQNGDLTTLYAHCSSINVKEGQNVKMGDSIGKVGMTGNATGPHLHFEIRYEGRYIDPQKILDL